MTFEWGSIIFCNLFLSNVRQWNLDGETGQYAFMLMKNMDLFVLRKWKNIVFDNHYSLIAAFT